MKHSSHKIFIICIALAWGNLWGQEFEACSHLKKSLNGLSKPRAVSLNQRSYDVTFYGMNLDLYPDQMKINGKVTIQFQILQSNFSQLELDFSGNMTVDSVLSAKGIPLKFTHSNQHILTVTLDQNFDVGDRDTVSVFYQGSPQGTGFGSFGFNSYNGKHMIWTLSEPYGARTWWPCKDTPTDKADSVDITVSVPITPDTLIVASNGLLKNIEYENKRATYYWQERYPITTYLVSLAIYPYRVFYDWYEYGVKDSMRLDYYVFPDNYSLVRPNYLKTKDMMGAYAPLFGEYPFIQEKYGHADFIWGGGMEHQTLSSMGGYSEGLIAHELTHQWWGDLVTCGNFHHIWLNEGFATYGEALWYEAAYGEETFHQDMESKKYFGSGTVYCPDTTSVRTIFDGDLSYDKASWVLHMLRHVVGDSLFFEGIRAYRNHYEFNSATTENFRDIMASVSGKNLDPFFQQWIYGEYFPVYDVRFHQFGDSLRLIIKQEQENTGLFTMPIDFKIECTDTILTTVVENSLAEEVVFISLPSGQKVRNVILDPGDWILKSATVLGTESELPIPDSFTLHPVFPNPFNPRATIQFDINKLSFIDISVYDILGNHIETLLYQEMNQGLHTLHWNAGPASAGIYFVQMTANKLSQTQKMILLK